MDYSLSLVALLLLVLGGTALSRLLVTEQGMLGILETLSLGILVGTGLVSIALFALGQILAGLALRLSVALICLALPAMSLIIRPPRISGLIQPSAISPAKIIALTLLFAQLCFVIWFVLNRGLGWDGIMVWEIKARLICLNNGVMPLGYFSDPTRRWSHPEYPLLLPMAESWLYSWIGRCDQGLVKFIFPPFYLAAIGLLYVGSSKQGAQGTLKFIAPLLMFFVPLVIVQEGSISSGYADYPLAVYYLGAVIYLLDYFRTKSSAALYAASALGALLPWVKTEGAILWFSLMVLQGLVATLRRELRPIIAMGLPGVCVILGWMLITRSAGATSQDFYPFSPGVLWMNLSRSGTIFGSLGIELLRASHWGVLWLGVAVVTLLNLFTSRNRLRYAHLILIVLPITMYSLTYYFSRWNPVSLHIDSSLNRLLLQPSLMAVLYVSIPVALGCHLRIGRAMKSSVDTENEDGGKLGAAGSSVQTAAPSGWPYYQH